MSATKQMPARAEPLDTPVRRGSACRDPARWGPVQWRPVLSGNRRPQIGTSAFGAALCVGSAVSVMAGGWIAHGAVRPDEAYGWRELIVAAVAAGSVAVRAGACAADPEAVRASVLRHGNAMAPFIIVTVGAAVWMLTAGGDCLAASAFMLCSVSLLAGLDATSRRALRWLAPLRLAVVATGSASRSLTARLSPPDSLHTVIAILDPVTRTIETGTAVGSEPGSVGTRDGMDQIVDLIRADTVQAVLIDPSGLGDGQLAAVLDRLAETPVEVRFAMSPAPRWRSGWQSGAEAGRRMVGWRAGLKRAEDLALAGLMLAVLLPLLAMIAVAVRCDSAGPVFFRQRRYGFNNRVIEVLKFRTMRHADRDVAGAVQAMPGDVRVTRVGRVLRRFSLDELPQLLNVLGGSMSIVGPRPHAIWTRTEGVLFEEAVPGYAARHNVKPGITGLAQIRGCRGPTCTITDLERRVAYDLHYIGRWSILLDVQIVLATIPALLRADNAC